MPHTEIDRIDRQTAFLGNLGAAEALHFPECNLQGKPVHLNQNLVELLIFDAVQKILNRLYFGRCRVLCNFVKVCTRFLHTLIVPPVGIENRPIVNTELFDGVLADPQTP